MARLELAEDAADRAHLRRGKPDRAGHETRIPGAVPITRKRARSSHRVRPFGEEHPELRPPERLREDVVRPVQRRARWPPERQGRVDLGTRKARGLELPNQRRLM